MTGDMHFHDALDRLGPEHRAPRRQIPDVHRGFAATGAAASVDADRGGRES